MELYKRTDGPDSVKASLRSVNFYVARIVALPGERNSGRDKKRNFAPEINSLDPEVFRDIF